MKRILAFSAALIVIPVLVCAAGETQTTEETVAIVGEVQSSGVYPYKPDLVIGSALASAGPTDKADLRRVQILRSDGKAVKTITLDLSPLPAKGAPRGTSYPSNTKLEPGDVVVVPARIMTQVTRDFKDMPLVAALQSILRDTGISYSIDPMLAQANLKVTAVLRNVPLESALDTIANAAGVAYEMNDGVLKIKPATPSYYRQSAAVQGIAQTAQPQRTEVLNLQYADNSAVLPILSQVEGVSNVTGLGSNQIILQGSADALKEAKRTADILDTPGIYPRAVRITLDFTVFAAGKHYLLTAEGVGPEAEFIPINMDAQFPLDKGGMGRLQLNSRVRPDLIGAESKDILSQSKDAAARNISLTGSGTIRCRLPAEFNKDFDFAVSVPESRTPAAKLVIGGTASKMSVTGRVPAASARMNIGGREYGFDAYASATIEKGRVMRAAGQSGRSDLSQQRWIVAPAGAVRSGPAQYRDYVNSVLGAADALAEQGKFDEAKSVLTSALSHTPDNAELHARLGAVLLSQGHVEEAVIYLRKAVELDPTVPGYKEALERALAADKAR